MRGLREMLKRFVRGRENESVLHAMDLVVGDAVSYMQLE